MRPFLLQTAYTALIAGLSLMALSLTSYAQSKDAFLGKWIMDPDHSQFHARARPIRPQHDLRHEKRQPA